MVSGILQEREHRTTIAKFGLDAIITPQHDVKIVEINGANSGSKGLKGIDIDRRILEYIAVQYGLPVRLFGELENADYPYFVQKAEQIDFESRREIRCQAPDKWSKFVLPVFPPKKDHFKAVIWNHCKEYLFDETQYLVLNPFAVEHVVWHKNTTHTLLQGFDLRPRMEYLVRRNIPNTDIAPFTSEHVVIKPTDEAVGKNVVVLPEEGVNDILSAHDRYERFLEIFEEGYRSIEHEPNIIIEELIPSKKLFSQVTEKEHFGCMRYLILVESKKGKIRVNHYGGYWRLAPEPIEGNKCQQRFIANYSNGAIPESVSRSDLSLVRETVDAFFPTFYRRLLRLPLNERPDEGMTLEDYCY